MDNDSSMPAGEITADCPAPYFPDRCSTERQRLIDGWNRAALECADNAIAANEAEAEVAALRAELDRITEQYPLMAVRLAEVELERERSTQCPACGTKWTLHAGPNYPCVGNCPSCGSPEASIEQDAQEAPDAFE